MDNKMWTNEEFKIHGDSEKEQMIGDISKETAVGEKIYKKIIEMLDKKTINRQ